MPGRTALTGRKRAASEDRTPPPAQRPREGTSFNTLLAVAQLARETLQEDACCSRAGMAGGLLPSAAAGSLAPRVGMPTRLPRAVVQCGVQYVLRTLPSEDRQRLKEAQAFLAAV
ncbi:hypothetical protein ABPG77_002522 [Micractinium sp. CCAP 211/92]